MKDAKFTKTKSPINKHHQIVVNALCTYLQLRLHGDSSRGPDYYLPLLQTRTSYCLYNISPRALLDLSNLDVCNYTPNTLPQICSTHSFPHLG